MNTKDEIKVSKTPIPNKIIGNYEFNRFKPGLIDEDINIERCQIVGKHSDLSLDFAVIELWKFFYSLLQLSNKKIFCFLTGGYWRADNRINRYKGLDKLYGIQKDQLIDFGIITVNNSILNWGIIEITSENYIKAFHLSIKYENSIFFTGENANQQIMANLLNIVDFRSPEKSIYLNIPEAINIICKYDETAVYFNGWIETNDYYLDIFRPQRVKHALEREKI